MAHLVHPFKPVWDSGIRVLVLGTFPSEGSVKGGGYYGHPRNQFWRLMNDALGETFLAEISWRHRYDLLILQRVGLWDVVKECDRDGASSDAKLTNIVPNDFSPFLGTNARTPSLDRLVFTGKTAAKFFDRHCHPRDDLNMPSVVLPSPSPANAMPYARKAAAYRTAFEVR